MKFIEGRYNKENHTYYVRLSHLGLSFFGSAQLHPDDSYSELIGGKYAEIRATIRALKYEKRLKKIEFKEIEKFVKACTQYKNFDKTSPTAKAVFRQLNRRKKEITRLEDEIEGLESFIKEDIAHREKFLQALKDKKN